MSSDPTGSPTGPGGHTQVLSTVVLNKIPEITRLLDMVGGFSRESGLLEDDAADIKLVLDELVSNVIKYGHDDGLEHEIRVTVRVSPELLTIEVEDDGKPFNPLDAPKPNLDLPLEDRPIGGLGVFIVRTLADTLEYRRERDRNILRMQKKPRSPVRQ